MDRLFAREDGDYYDVWFEVVGENMLYMERRDIVWIYETRPALLLSDNSTELYIG